METDVKGQLGGLEAGEGVRRRLAGESRGWRCAVCNNDGGKGGKTNEEILGECEERVREMRGDSGEGQKEEEVKVPEELRMGWRDEMEGKGKGKEKEKEGEDEESARLAEGFVQTAPVGGSTTTTTGLGAVPSSREAVPPATRSAPAPNAPQPALQQVVRQGAPNQDVWLDRLIMALAIALAAVVAKVILA